MHGHGCPMWGALAGLQWGPPPTRAPPHRAAAQCAATVQKGWQLVIAAPCKGHIRGVQPLLLQTLAVHQQRARQSPCHTHDPAVTQRYCFMSKMCLLPHVLPSRMKQGRAGRRALRPRQVKARRGQAAEALPICPVCPLSLQLLQRGGVTMLGHPPQGGAPCSEDGRRGSCASCRH